MDFNSGGGSSQWRTAPEEVKHLAGNEPLKPAEDLLVAQSLSPAPFGVVPGGVVIAQPHHSDAMERSVGLAVAVSRMEAPSTPIS